MKNIFSISLGAALLLLAGCHIGSYFYDSDDDDNGRSTSTMEISDNGHHVKVKYSGDITFTDDETAIKSISPGGCIKYWEDGRKFIALSDANGVVTYQLYEEGTAINPADDRGKKFTAVVVKGLINLGFDADGRVDRIYKKGGAAAVLDEIDYLKGDWVRSRYYEALLNNKYLTPAEMVTTAKSIAETVGGNYEKQQLLQKFAAAYMQNPQTSQAWFSAANTITGDYEKQQVLQSAIDQNLTKTQVSGVLFVANGINGSYEKSEVLKHLIEKTGLGQDNCDKLLEVTSGIGGDYEKQGVLTELVQNDSFSTESFGKLMFVASHIGGNYEKSEVLKKVAEQNITSGDEWISLINTAALVDGANEKSEILVAIAQKMPRDEKTKAAYMEAAKTINGDYEYTQAVKATE